MSSADFRRTSPERNYCLMRNMGRHLHPRTCDTWEVLSPPTWNLPHIKHRGQIKYSPRILRSQNQSWTTGSRENQQLANTRWVSNAQGSRYQGAGRDGDNQRRRKINKRRTRNLSQCFTFGVSSHLHDNPRMQGLVYPFSWKEKWFKMVSLSQKVETVRRSCNRWTDQKSVIGPHNGISHSHQKELSSYTCYDMDELWRHKATLKKPDTKGQRPNDSTYMKYLKLANL